MDRMCSALSVQCRHPHKIELYAQMRVPAPRTMDAALIFGVHSLDYTPGVFCRQSNISRYHPGKVDLSLRSIFHISRDRHVRKMTG